VDYYYDDPVEEPIVRRKNPKAIFASALLLFAGGLFFNTTLAANININTGVAVEFGQGVLTSTACSGSTRLTITPVSSFVNVAGGGAFYFSSVSVSNIPVACQGKDFTISAYNSSSSSPLPIFNTNATSAVVYNNAGTFELGNGTTVGASISSQSGKFTLTFTSPVAAATSVNRLTIQSSDHGQTLGPGGGQIFYYSAAGFNCGPTYTNTCHYLEAAPNLWSGVSSEIDSLFPFAITPYDQQSVAGLGTYSLPDANGQIVSQIGIGYKNSLAIIAQGNGATTAAGAARAYRGGSKSDWYLPSVSELNLLCQKAKGITQNPTQICDSSVAPTGMSTGFGLLFEPVDGDAPIYLTSSQQGPNGYGSNADYSWGLGMSDGLMSDASKGNPYNVRPIRAF
jgi:hypothetical protein